MNLVVPVSIAIIPNGDGKILITQRAQHLSHGGYWEFPGGKIEANESPEDALLREIQEELGIVIRGYRFLRTVEHTYEHSNVQLHAYWVSQYQGTPKCLESQKAMAWVHPSALSSYAFPAANHEIIKDYLLPIQ